MHTFLSSSERPLSLLFVEDDPIAREAALRSLGRTFPFLRFHEAQNGKRGLELYHEHRPDIVVTDVNMPIMDGITMAQQVVSANHGAHIIVISGHTELPYLLRAIKIGIRHYVLKPIEHKQLFSAVADCVKRVQQERQLREQERSITLLSKVVEQNSNHIAIADSNGKVRYTNHKFTELTGYQPQEMLDRDLRQLHFKDAPEQDFDAVWELVTRGEEWRGEGMNRKKDGEVYREAASIAPILDHAGGISHFVTIREDVTARRNAEQELERARKLESLGGVAGGIAHDFNNVLTAVLGNVSFALTGIAASHPFHTALQEAERAALRAAQLTKELLTFSRGGAPVKKEASIRGLVERSVPAWFANSGIVCDLSIPEDLDVVALDEGQMLQAFQSMLANAGEAMAGGGRVAVRVEQVFLARDNDLGLAPGRYVRISFADQGEGVPEEVKPRIFDPYFSTKPGHSGLGLASAHSIVARHGGHLGLSCSAPTGSVFVCHLPAGDPIAEEPACELAALSPAAAGGAVLVMDDEAPVRSIAAKMLSCLGYRSTTCSNGVDAVAAYSRARSNGRPYLAVILDLSVVGGMGGKEAAEHILQRDPEARLVVSSGYSDDPVLADPARYGFHAVLPKPYRVADLAEVQAVVQTASAA